MRQIVLDTETTGLNPKQGHRIIEIGCVELLHRRRTDSNPFQTYLNPERDIDEGAQEVHGISLESLADKPKFFDIADDFLSFINGAELVIHNAPFDVGFINHEIHLLEKSAAGRKLLKKFFPSVDKDKDAPKDKWGKVGQICTVLDTLVLARKKHPGQKNNLDALCKRYEIDNSQRELHGALLDAEILAETYLAMSGGQVHLSLDGATQSDTQAQSETRRLKKDRSPLRVIRASSIELQAHEQRLQAIDKTSDGACVWKQLELPVED